MKRMMVCLGLIAGLAACGGDDKPGNTGGGVDAGATVDTGGGGTVDDTTTGTDDTGTATGDGGGGGGGEPGSACKSNSDCDVPVCLESASGSVCAKPCTDDTSCTDGQVCTQVAGTGGDSVTVCVDRQVRLCDPCKSNDACVVPGASGAACVDRGKDGAFCGVPCGGTLPGCPTGSECKDVTDIEGKATKQCVPAGGALCACSPLAISKELSTACQVGDGATGCPGVRACLADGKENAPAGGGLSACIGEAPKAEACNGADDDCDGATDEEASCDDGNPCTTDACKDGKCANTSTTGACDDGDGCTEGDTCAGGTCVGGKKDCDDKNPCTDDSCDPKADGGKGGCVNTPKTGACDDGDACTADDTCDGGSCTGKKKSCDDGNACTADVCDKTTGACQSTPSTGSCDDGDPCTEGDTCATDAGSGQLVCKAGKAKDCDDKNPCTKDSCDATKGCVSTVDTSATQACYSGAPSTKGVGECKAGTQACKADGSLGPCTGEVTPAGKEACDGKDDTCDGKTDEGCPTGTGKPQVAWRLGSTTVSGASGGNQVRVFVGGDSVAGPSTAAGKSGVDIGFYAWLKSWLK